MVSVSLSQARKALDEHRYRKDAAAALGIKPHWFYYTFGGGRRSGPLCDSMVAAMHRMGLPLDRTAEVSGVSVGKVVRIIQAAEHVEIARITFAAERAAWRSYSAAIPARQVGA